MKPKPRIFSDVQESTVQSWGGEFVRRLVSVRWLVACDCHSTRFAIAATPSWEGALIVARTHLEAFHA